MQLAPVFFNILCKLRATPLGYSSTTHPSCATRCPPKSRDKLSKLVSRSHECRDKFLIGSAMTRPWGKRLSLGELPSGWSCIQCALIVDSGANDNVTCPTLNKLLSSPEPTKVDKIKDLHLEVRSGLAAKPRTSSPGAKASLVHRSGQRMQQSWFTDIYSKYQSQIWETEGFS